MQRACAPLCTLSLGRRRSTRASEVRAPRSAGSICLTIYGKTLLEREAALLAAQGRALTCQPLSSLSEVGCECSALARHCARSLLGGGAARALPKCARRAALAAFASRSMEGHCLSEKPLFLLRKAVLSRASACPHLVRWVARAACLHATALALSWEEAQHARFRSALAAPRSRHLLHALWKGIA